MTSIFSLFDWCNRRLHYPEKIILILASSTLAYPSIAAFYFTLFNNFTTAHLHSATNIPEQVIACICSQYPIYFTHLPGFHFISFSYFLGDIDLSISWFEDTLQLYHCKLILSSLEYCLIIYPIPCFLTSNKMLNVFVYSTRCYSLILSSCGTGQVNLYSVRTTYY